MKDVLLEKRYEGKIEIVPAKTLIDVLMHSLVSGDALIKKAQEMFDR